METDKGRTGLVEQRKYIDNFLSFEEDLQTNLKLSSQKTRLVKSLVTDTEHRWHL